LRWRVSSSSKHRVEAKRTILFSLHNLGILLVVMSAAMPLVASLASHASPSVVSATSKTVVQVLANSAASASASAAASTAAAAASAVPVRLSEITLTCGEGLQLAAQSYVPLQQQQPLSSSSGNDSNRPSLNGDANAVTPPARKILCLHGWMDNCRSFHYLAPLLTAQLNAHVVALDLPGHGVSGHKAHDSPPTVLAEAAYYVHEAVRQLDWPKGFCVVGHSMGAAVGSLYAASFPEYVSQLVLLDGAGPLARNPLDIAKHVRMHVERRQLATTPAHVTRPPRVYETLEHAVQARMATARTFPGNQYLSHGAALELVRRGTRPAHGANANANGAALNSSNAGDHDGHVQFTHDPRLSWPSAQYFTEEQNDGIFRSIQCPVAFLRAEHGWPFDEAKAKRFLSLLKPSLATTLPGSHHFHADPDTAPEVADAVVQWLQAEME
jgi:pimeloyl-ACP methyl ester carboxylesterase